LLSKYLFLDRSY